MSRCPYASDIKSQLTVLCSTVIRKHLVLNFSTHKSLSSWYFWNRSGISLCWIPEPSLKILAFYPFGKKTSWLLRQIPIHSNRYINPHTLLHVGKNILKLFLCISDELLFIGKVHLKSEPPKYYLGQVKPGIEYD